ncbi:N-6 DNA methylase [Aestuariivirga sp.]|uniref:N-6 DNA methylase n=1 Tax=Aestuariivirga sp. TaxID=2650926 RepID=UPI0025C3FF8D|nr:N-6 DNA methylase [Aestuariivirga sp.]MCA3554499.1 N-6 DNA methylase [Aestuariivirga sp.]
MNSAKQAESRTLDILRHLASQPGHDEVKADFRELLIEEFQVDRANLEFERRIPEVRGRLDALIGRTVFEAKSNLAREWADVERRMPDYLRDREAEEGERFVGIASDGLRWSVFELSGGKLSNFKETQLNPEKAAEFLAWLDGVLALKSSLPPDVINIKAELGYGSVAYRRASDGLRQLWNALKADRATMLKRQLWSSLLKLVYGKEIENDELWLQHSYLVIVAKAIALAVLDVNEDDPRRLLSGESFQRLNILGAVESDFFDWVTASAEGEDLVRRIMAHVRRFRLREVQSDVLKVLYESLIDRAERHGLGEYYTPDWLAAKVVRQSVTAPVEQRVLDPACGSGTFLFHAVRNFIAEAEDAGMKPNMVAAEVTAHVAGMDIHPVSVIIARVTYLLALAPALGARDGAVSIPVYLGDAMQLSISEWMGGKELTIKVPPSSAGNSTSGEGENGREQLDFPDTFCRDPALFDKAIERMRTGSLEGMKRDQIEAALKRIVEQHYKRDINQEEEFAIKDMGKTYVVFDRLRRDGRDSVWAYVARNLSRPLFFSAAGGWANVAVGNPPWVAFRHMSADLQKKFRELARGERVYVGGKLATQNDLCALFMVRAADLYLRAAGRIAFVLPLAALTRGQFAELRRGSFHSTRLAYDAAWTMDDGVQPLFPVPACVLFARKRATARPVPDIVTAYAGNLPYRDAPEELADRHLQVRNDAPRPEEANFESGSAYRKAFRQGATLVPRMLCLVERGQTGGRLAPDRSSPFVVSRRNSQEKEPWKSLSGIEGRVEAEFIRPVLLGESILPYRVLRPFEGVVPVTEKGAVLDADAAANRGYSGLTSWMMRAEKVWEENAESGKMTLVGRWNYHNELGSQFPIGGIKVLYCRSGSLQASAILQDDRTIIDFALYWSKVKTIEEARYLSAFFNSEESRRRVEMYQSRGQWGARDFAKVMFNLNWPVFDPDSNLHRRLAAAAADAENLASTVEIPDGMKFQRARRLVRDALTEAGIAQKIDKLVARLLDGA